MADQVDVEQALVEAVTVALYPQGTAAPYVPGPVCRVYRGWPVAGALDADLAAGRVHVAVLPLDGSLRVTTRFQDDWVIGAPVAATLHVAVDGDVVTFSGTADAGQLAGVLVDGRAFVHRTEAGDTPGLVVAALAARVRAHRIALAAGPVLAVPGAARLLARVVADQAALRETRRQAQGFRIACFCPSPAMRDATVAAIDAAMAMRRFLDLPDGSAGRLLFSGTTTLDTSRDAALYRRDLTYTVEYATTAREMQAAMLFGAGSLGATSYIS